MPTRFPRSGRDSSARPACLPASRLPEGAWGTDGWGAPLVPPGHSVPEKRGRRHGWEGAAGGQCEIGWCFCARVRSGSCCTSGCCSSAARPVAPGSSTRQVGKAGEPRSTPGQQGRRRGPRAKGEQSALVLPAARQGTEARSRYAGRVAAGGTQAPSRPLRGREDAAATRSSPRCLRGRRRRKSR